MTLPASLPGNDHRTPTTSDVPPRPPSTSARGRAAERRVAWHYRLRGYRILARNVRAGGVELDLIVQRGRRLVFCEVKLKEGPGYGDPLDAVDEWKRERLRRGAQAWLLANPAFRHLRVAFEFAAVRPGGIELVSDLLQ
ncbi:MAG: YraN family protein [Actinobacteria bacterium]|nr:MAG: YraN family protein [Actinomycetota bacterium]